MHTYMNMSITFRCLDRGPSTSAPCTISDGRMYVCMLCALCNDFNSFSHLCMYVSS